MSTLGACVIPTFCYKTTKLPNIVSIIINVLYFSQVVRHDSRKCRVSCPTGKFILHTPKFNMPQFLAKTSFRQQLKDLSECEIHQKLAYIASFTLKIIGITYMFSNMGQVVTILSILTRKIGAINPIMPSEPHLTKTSDLWG